MFQEDFYLDLRSIPEVASFTGGRVFPGVAPKDFTGDQFITFNAVFGGMPELQFGGSKGLTSQTMQIDIYSTDYGVNNTVAQYIKDHYHGFTGTLNANTFVTHTRVTDHRNTLDSVNPRFHRSMLTIQFTY